MRPFAWTEEFTVQCPVCGDEYEDGLTMCTTCAVPLLPPGATAPSRTRHLGRFASPVGERVVQLLDAKGIPHQDEWRDDEWAVRVDAEWRDAVASQLYTGWSELLLGLDRDVAYRIFELGGTHPGWFDAPDDAWTDREGRLQVAIEDDADSGRALGPALALVGLAMLLLGMVDAIDTGMGVSFGLALAALGALLPR